MTDLQHLQSLAEKATNEDPRFGAGDFGNYGWLVKISGEYSDQVGIVFDEDEAIAREVHSKEYAEFIAALINSWPSIYKELLAGRKLAKSVERFGQFEGMQFREAHILTQRDSALSTYESALK